MTDEGSHRPVYDLVLSLDGVARGAIVALATVFTLNSIRHAQAVLGLIAVAALCAIALQPLIAKLARAIGFAPALVAVHIAGFVAFGGLAGLVAWDLDSQAEAVEASLHTAIDDLEPGSWPAALASDIDAHRRVASFFGSIATRSVAGDAAATAVLHRLGQAILVTVLSAFLVAGRRQILGGLASIAASKSRRRAIRETLGTSALSAGAYLRRSIVVSGAHGLTVAGVTAAFGLRTGVSLAAAAALLSTVPMLGPAAAWAPTFVLATTHYDRPAWEIAGIAALATVVDWVARDRYVERRVRVGPLLVALGLAGGVAAGGIAGAALGLFVAACVAGFTASPAAVAAAAERFVEERAPDEVEMPVLAGATPADDSTAPARLSVRISWRSAIAVGALVVAAAATHLLLARMGAILIWIIIALIIALGVDRPISFAQRLSHLPRVVVVVIGIALMVTASTLLFVITAPQASRSSSALVEDAPEVVASLQNLPLIGPVLENADAATRVEETIRELPDRVADSRLIERAASVAGDGVVGLFWTVVILLSALIDGPRLVDAIAAKIPVRHRRQYVRLARAGQHAIARYAAGSALVATLNGIMVLTGALLLGIPLAPVLALWALAWNFVPQIGGFMGGAPFVLLALGEAPTKGVIAFVLFIVYQTIENHVIQPAVIGRSVDLAPWVALVSALVGASVGGLLGAVLAVPFVGAVKVMVTEWRRDDFPITTAVRPRRPRLGRRTPLPT
ncbi:MAG TPA: AI-2E family transporter [Acidimicrobiales bacterium]|nr:AI-2E family transporter [Acidimicrobiales bacterium]